MIETRVCNRCNKEKDLKADFYKSKGYYLKKCKACECRDVYSRRMEKFKLNPESYRKYRDKWNSVYREKRRILRENKPVIIKDTPKDKKCSECKKIKPVEDFSRTLKYGKYVPFSYCKPCESRVKILRQRGLTEESYKDILIYQNESCAICDSEDPKSKGSKNGLLFIDHDHESDEVRGLLCNPCNLYIGILDKTDDIEKYLDRLLLYVNREPYSQINSKREHPMRSMEHLSNKNETHKTCTGIHGCFKRKPLDDFNFNKIYYHFY